MKTRILLSALAACLAPPLLAAPLTQSTFTEIIHDVNVVSMPVNAAKPATVNELFKSPDLVRTGPDSRAELTAPDQTITRVGANTAFSFEPAGRDINLEQGSILFHSPSGKGGGTIKSGGASAAVLGTTLIVATTPVTAPTDKNGFKVILLEGHGKVTLSKGKSRKLHAGQMIFILPGQTDFGPVLDINLAKLVSGSKLVSGFGHDLPSLPLIEQAIDHQQKDLASGQTEDTGVPADKFPQLRNIPGNGTGVLDDNTFHLGVVQPVFTSINQPPPPGQEKPPITPPNLP
ncbi:MAG: iron dicitrate transport regulator FecR [Pedosphaera sp.]|nr:iron dicitrate transport regulator FecR [Pedosphaera sp.]